MVRRIQVLCSVLMVTLLGCAVHELPPSSPPRQEAITVEEHPSERVTMFLGIKLAPCGRTRALGQRTPSSHRCILDTQ